MLEAYRMFANDHGWSHKLHEAVATGLTAEAAVERVQSDTRARMLRSTDPYLRDRLHDLEDLGHRLMRQLVGQDHAPSREQLPDNAILIARAMGPAALLDYDRKRLRGLVLEEGTANSHVSIVARALGIPAVGEIPNASGIADAGDAIIVDGTSGSIYIRPSAEIESAYAERVRFRARRQAQYSALRDKPCVTKDGQKIELMINAGLVIDLPHIDDTGSAGIGLFRTELQFMVGQSLPRTSDQLALYRTVLDAAGSKPVTFRTLDIGGDKALPYMETVIEENPALGWRAIRLGLDRPGLLRGQIRALLRAGGGRALKIMFPMISEVAEFDQAKAIVERELTYLRQHGHALPERIDVGTMVEVPALLYQMDELLKKVDFVSVGSNDLFQFLFAVDRGNGKVSERFDTMSAPILRALREIVTKANAAKKSASLCGEMASKPLGALALIALGYRSLSLSATAHGPVKALILDLDAKKAEAVMTPLLDAPSGSVSIRQKLTEFAEAEGLVVVARFFAQQRHPPPSATENSKMLPEAKLDILLAHHASLEAELLKQLASEKYVQITRELAELNPVIDAVKAYRAAGAEIADTETLLADSATDPEMRGMAEAELETLRARVDELAQKIRVALLPKDAMDDRNVVLEIRAGTGGDEASLFAGDLFRMYERFAALQGWKVEVISASEGTMGGYKEIIAEVQGRGAFAKLKFESGVHRVQRVPDTETQGRIHTSAATVAVLPEVEEVDVDIKNDDLRIETMRAQGAGGQHVNKTKSAIRITHIPTGIVVMMQDSRSQHKNRASAMNILRSRIYDAEQQRINAVRSADRREKVGSGDRSERIRTYNFPQGRVSDHRINLTLYKLPQVIAGEALGELVDALTTEHQAAQLAAQGAAA